MTADNQLYSKEDSFITGIRRSSKKQPEHITYRNILSTKDRIIVAVYSAGYVSIAAIFLYIVLSSFTTTGMSVTTAILAVSGFISLIIIESLRIFQGITIPYFALTAKDPVFIKPENHLRVALLTTIVPSKEPIEVVEKTLKAMKKVKYGGLVDVWILDEGNDERVIAMAERLGVKHFSRFGFDMYNQKSGEFKAKTKAGNHNSWRAEHENNYDIVAQMDPDHIPFENFLERILGYFRDKEVAFVVAPQVYGNQRESFIAHAAAEQAYIFHGLIQRSGNNCNSPLLIGTNHAYRVSAWKQINGYQDSIIEDHLTSLVLHSTVNSDTKVKWKGVYTPDIVSVGEGPTTWTDYFNQQKRWAFGVWEILLKHNIKHYPRFTPKQFVHYFSLQSFYPSIALSWILSLFISIITLFLGVNFLNVDVRLLLALWFVSVGSQILFSMWVMRFNLTKHEKSSLGLRAMLLTLLVAPVYSSAALAAVLQTKLQYAVTAKGDMRTRDSWTTFTSHMTYLACYILLVLIGLVTAKFYSVSLYWSLLTLAVLLPLPVWFTYSKLKEVKFKPLLSTRLVHKVRTLLF